MFLEKLVGKNFDDQFFSENSDLVKAALFRKEGQCLLISPLKDISDIKKKKSPEDCFLQKFN